jgi:hypothetical protein
MNKMAAGGLGPAVLLQVFCPVHLVKRRIGIFLHVELSGFGIVHCRACNAVVCVIGAALADGTGAGLRGAFVADVRVIVVANVGGAVAFYVSILIHNLEFPAKKKNVVPRPFAWALKKAGSRQ